MNKILWLMGCLYLILTVTLSAFILAARLQPAPDKLTQLHLDKCSPPCWNGIKPGVTTYDEAKALLNATFGQSDYARIDEINGELNVDLYPSKINDHCLSVWLAKSEASPAIIDNIMFLHSFYSGCSVSGLDLRDMIMLFGVPDYVIADIGNHSPQLPMIVYMSTPSNGIWIQFRDYSDRILFDVLEFYSGNKFNVTTALQPWRGIARFNR